MTLHALTGVTMPTLELPYISVELRVEDCYFVSCQSHWSASMSLYDEVESSVKVTRLHCSMDVLLNKSTSLEYSTRPGVPCHASAIYTECFTYSEALLASTNGCATKPIGGARLCGVNGIYKLATYVKTYCVVFWCILLSLFLPW